MSFAKKKGYRGEKELEAWMTKVSGVIYKRTPSSGAMHQDWPYDITKKGHEDSVFDGVGNEMKNTAQLRVGEWIDQAEVAASDAGQFTIKYFVAFKYKGKIYFVLNKEYYEEILSVQKKALDKSREVR